MDAPDPDREPLDLRGHTSSGHDKPPSGLPGGPAMGVNVSVGNCALLPTRPTPEVGLG